MGKALLVGESKAKKTKVRHWAQCNVLNRLVASKLNELSASGHQIFGVHQSVSIGGSYEVIYYIDKPAGE